MIPKEAIEALREAYSKYGQTGDLMTTPPSFECAEAILTAAFAAMPGPAVKVKPLEWINVVIGDGSPFRQQTWNADRYQIVESPSGKFDLRHGAYAICDTLEAAKSAAQADYEARILSALTPAPDLASESERLRAALEEIANAYSAHGYSDAIDAVQSLKDIAKEALNAKR